MKNKLIIKLLTVLGFGAMFSGCEILVDIGVNAEYGCPTARYEVKGKVTDTENTPIEGIKVVMKVVDVWDEDEHLFRVDSMQTDAKGEYLVKTYDFPLETRELRIEASDIDGTDNGGEFATVEKTVVFDKSYFSGGDGHWYYGSAGKELDLELEKKE